MPIPHANTIYVEIHSDKVHHQREVICMLAANNWIKCSALDLIVTAANRVWERGQSRNYYNPARINMRGDCKFIHGRPA